ncbi:MAG: CcmD family protein, partial [Verrucomicrobiota bacterium]
VLPAAAGAEGAQSADVPPPGYERVSGAQQPEEVSPEPLVIAAYGLIWALVLGYVLLLWRRQRRVESEFEELRGSIERISKT